MKNNFAQAAHGSGSWTLPPNDVWNLPDGVGEVRGELRTFGPWSLPASYRALAVDSDCKVYGVRTLSHVRESGYALEGRVKVGGKSYRGFTSSQLFQRPDGSLVDVAVIHVCNDGDQFPVPNVDGMTDDEVNAFIAKHWYATGVRKQLKDYAWEVRMARQARLAGNIQHALNCEQTAQSIYDALPEWAKW
jgi:hypothetical protein